MPDYPPEALDAAIAALRERSAVDHGSDLEKAARWHAKVALDAAAPVLAGQIAAMILRYADENEPEPGSAGYLAWHRHFEAASAVAAKAFGRDNLEHRDVRETCPVCGHMAHPETPAECRRCPEGYCEALVQTRPDPLPPGFIVPKPTPFHPEVPGA